MLLTATKIRLLAVHNPRSMKTDTTLQRTGPQGQLQLDSSCFSRRRAPLPASIREGEENSRTGPASGSAAMGHIRFVHPKLGPKGLTPLGYGRRSGWCADEARVHHHRQILKEPRTCSVYPGGTVLPDHLRYLGPVHDGLADEFLPSPQYTSFHTVARLPPAAVVGVRQQARNLCGSSSNSITSTSSGDLTNERRRDVWPGLDSTRSCLKSYAPHVLQPRQVWDTCSSPQL